MNIHDSSQELEKIMRDRGLGWAIDLYAPSDQAAAHYMNSLKQLEIVLRNKGLLGSSSFTPQSITQLIASSPYKADAFLQALVSVRSTEILCATWRILQGMEISELNMSYRHRTSFELRIVLSSPYGETEEYRSQDINDVVFVKHLGKTLINGQPIFDGFHALRQN